MRVLRQLWGWLAGRLRSRQPDEPARDDVDLGPEIGVCVVAEDRWLDPTRG